MRARAPPLQRPIKQAPMPEQLHIHKQLHLVAAQLPACHAAQPLHQSDHAGPNSKLLLLPEYGPKAQGTPAQGRCMHDVVHMVAVTNTQAAGINPRPRYTQQTHTHAHPQEQSAAWRPDHLLWVFELMESCKTSQSGMTKSWKTSRNGASCCMGI